MLNTITISLSERVKGRRAQKQLADHMALYPQNTDVMAAIMPAAARRAVYNSFYTAANIGCININL